MSDAASVPFTETKAPESAERLHRGALSLIDISASTMANIGPAYSFFFGFGFLVFTAGVGAPPTLLLAGLAIAFLGHTLAQLSTAQPSPGGVAPPSWPEPSAPTARRRRAPGRLGAP